MLLLFISSYRFFGGTSAFEHYSGFVNYKRDKLFCRLLFFQELELEIHKLARPPDTLGEGSYGSTVTHTRRIVTNGSERSSSTTTYKVSMFRFRDQFIQRWFYLQLCIIN